MQSLGFWLWGEGAADGGWILILRAVYFVQGDHFVTGFRFGFHGGLSWRAVVN